MVRKKADTSRRNIFAPPGKLMMIQRNKDSLASLKTPTSSRMSTPNTPEKKSQSISKNDSTVNKTSKTKKRRLKPGVKALREIKKFQSNTCLLIPKAPFSRVVREILQDKLNAPEIRFSSLGLMALQEATEMAIVNLLEVANLCCIHAHRVTLMPSDIRLTRRAFGLANPVND